MFDKLEDLVVRFNEILEELNDPTVVNDQEKFRKLMKEQNDLSDIVGVLIEQEERNKPLSFEIIQKAVVDLYDSYDKIPKASRTFIEAVYKKEDLHEFYKQCRELEQENKDVLVGFQEDYPGVLNGDNLADILKAAKAKKQQ